MWLINKQSEQDCTYLVRAVHVHLLPVDDEHATPVRCLHNMRRNIIVVIVVVAVAVRF
jgi:1-deoxy-D-xylulose 5-phosphate reductoisomerase